MVSGTAFFLLHVWKNFSMIVASSSYPSFIASGVSCHSTANGKTNPYLILLSFSLQNTRSGTSGPSNINQDAVSMGLALQNGVMVTFSALKG